MGMRITGAVVMSKIKVLCGSSVRPILSDLSLSTSVVFCCRTIGGSLCGKVSWPSPALWRAPGVMGQEPDRGDEADVLPFHGQVEDPVHSGQRFVGEDSDRLR